VKCNQKPYCARERGHEGVCLDGAALTAANLTAERDEARREEALLIDQVDAYRVRVAELEKQLAEPGCGEACPVATRLKAEAERLTRECVATGDAGEAAVAVAKRWTPTTSGCARRCAMQPEQPIRGALRRLSRRIIRCAVPFATP